MNDSDQIRILLDEILASQSDMLASMSRLEDSLARLQMRLVEFEMKLAMAVSQEVAQITMMTAQRRRLLDARAASHDGLHTPGGIARIADYEVVWRKARWCRWASSE
ncbi:hypothetical protein [Paraburkholderia sp. RL18-085-BIA-A]|uniref:hypothetical protein n=1 Tax=Paraburkholderia sp. RL18-085-BIA-A TaxID=3031633 RepID=UPI0038BD8EBB